MFFVDAHIKHGHSFKQRSEHVQVNQESKGQISMGSTNFYGICFLLLALYNGANMTYLRYITPQVHSSGCLNPLVARASQSEEGWLKERRKGTRVVCSRMNWGIGLRPSIRKIRIYLSCESCSGSPVECNKAKNGNDCKRSPLNILTLQCPVCNACSF